MKKIEYTADLGIQSPTLESRGKSSHNVVMSEKAADITPKVTKTDTEWRELLTPLEYHVLREAGTERPGTGALLSENRAGMYYCRACGAELFRSETKFESFCGWPSFFDPNEQDAVVYIKDLSLGMERTEVRCANCGSHLGHVFPDAPHTPTGLRYCMNSASLSFTPEGNEANAWEAPESDYGESHGPDKKGPGSLAAPDEPGSSNESRSE